MVTETEPRSTSGLLSISTQAKNTLVIDTDNPEYKLHVGRIGETLTNLTHRIRPYKELHECSVETTTGMDGRQVQYVDDRLIVQTSTQDLHTLDFVMKQPPVANVKMDGFHLHVGDVSYGNVAFIDYQWKGNHLRHKVMTLTIDPLVRTRTIGSIPFPR